MINKVILVGNMGADPEIRTFENGNKVARIRIATTERIYNRETQERRDHTEWHTITLWRNLASFAEQYARKGSQVYIEGKIRSREWEDENKNRRTAMEIVADDFRLLGRRSDNPASETASGGYNTSRQGASYGQQPAQNPYQAPAAAPSDDFTPTGEVDDLPF